MQSKMKNFLVIELFLIFSVSTVLAADYDDTYARYKVWPMASAAYSNNPSLCISDNFANATFKGQYTLPCDIAPNDTCSGFTAASHSDKAIILSFRGTKSELQLINEIIEELLLPPYPFAGGGGVNLYFFDAFNDIWNFGMKNDFLSLKNAYPNYELWVTGHSLGGAMASIGAATISYLGYVPPEKIKLVTFGQPRVGDPAYASAVDRLISYSFRVVHNNDIGPHLPPLGMLDYIHHRSEVWYNNNMTIGSTYIVCKVDEGGSCSDSAIDLSIDDHRYYFNKMFNFTVNGCAGYNPNP